MNLTSIHKDAGLILGLTQWVRIGIAVSCGVVHRHGSDLVLLWLWCRPVAPALIQPLAWEPPYAKSTALKKPKKKKNSVGVLLWCSIVTEVSWIAAMVWIQSLARELLYAVGTDKKKKEKRKKNQCKLKDLTVFDVLVYCHFICCSYYLLQVFQFLLTSS